MRVAEEALKEGLKNELRNKLRQELQQETEGTGTDGPEHPAKEKSGGPCRESKPEEGAYYTNRGSLHQRVEHQGDRNENCVFIPLRSVLILGDSKINRVPVFQNCRVQLISYPGSQWSNNLWTFRHHASMTPETQAVVLSFGIDDRFQGKTTSTLSKMVQGAFSLVKSVFRIRIPLLNFNYDIPKAQRQTLYTILDLGLQEFLGGVTGRSSI